MKLKGARWIEPTRIFNQLKVDTHFQYFKFYFFSYIILICLQSIFYIKEHIIYCTFLILNDSLYFDKCMSPLLGTFLLIWFVKNYFSTSPKIIEIILRIARVPVFGLNVPSFFIRINRPCYTIRILKTYFEFIVKFS